MQSYVLRSSVILALACSMVACAKEDADDGGSGEGPGTVPAAEECDPDGEVPCFENYAEPCEGYSTQFPGDEYCRKAPDPSIGFQLHVGPTDYSDPDQTDTYVILPGEETNFYEISPVSPYADTVYTRGYHSYMRPGSHHMIMYGVNDESAPSGPVHSGEGVESARGALGGVFLGGATRAVQNIDTRGALPEDQGIGSEIPPGRRTAVNLHFINLEQQPLLQEIWVNFILIDEAEVTKYVKPITWYGGILMDIAPGVHTTLASNPQSCTAPADMRIAMMTAHAHASTLRVSSHKYPLAGGDPQLLIEDFDWHEPTEWRFNNSVTNPVPDRASKQSGGASGLVTAVPGDHFSWECEVENKQNVNLTFGNKLITGEMCNVFGFYFTEQKSAAPWTCVFM